MSAIQVSNLTFAYEGSYDNIFEDASFRIDTDWRLGFIGRNGRGKTTFLQLLMGRHAYGGTISCSVEFDYFPFEVADGALDTLDVLAGVAPDVPQWQINRELSLLSVGADVLYRPFHTLSGGEQTKALLAGLFLRENHFLLIDEPTNHLDGEARETVGKYLKSKKGFILVSHDRMLLDSCVDHVLSINKANIEVQKGNFSSWYHNKEMQDAYEREKNAQLGREVRRLTETSREKAQWSDKLEKTKIGTHQADRGRVGHLAAKMMKRSKTMEGRRQSAIDEKSRLLKNIEEAESLKIIPLAHHAHRLVTLDDVAVAYGGNTVCEHVNLALMRGERLAVCGKNGSGKTSVLKLILGEDVPHTGDVQRASGLKISFVPQDASSLGGNLSDYAARHEIDESVFKALLRKLDFSRVQFEKDMADYSGGQKKKVLIARSLCEQAHLYIWDEPLNFIDVLSRIQIEELLLAHNPTMIFIEHDGAFRESVATRKLEVGV